METTISVVQTEKCRVFSRIPSCRKPRVSGPKNILLFLLSGMEHAVQGRWLPLPTIMFAELASLTGRKLGASELLFLGLPYTW